MTLPRSAADVLSGHVVFELECIDRIYCNLYVPKLQRDLGVVGFIREYLGRPVASTAVLADRVPLEYSIARLTWAIASRLDAVMVGWPGAAQDRLPVDMPGTRRGYRGVPWRRGQGC
jgi:hypothetical protein